MLARQAFQRRDQGSRGVRQRLLRVARVKIVGRQVNDQVFYCFILYARGQGQAILLGFCKLIVQRGFDLLLCLLLVVLIARQVLEDRIDDLLVIVRVQFHRRQPGPAQLRVQLLAGGRKHRVHDLARPIVQGLIVAGQGVQPVPQLLDPVGQLARDAVVQLDDPIGQLAAHRVVQLHHPVQQLGRAVQQFVGGVPQLVDVLRKAVQIVHLVKVAQGLRVGGAGDHKADGRAVGHVGLQAHLVVKFVLQIGQRAHQQPIQALAHAGQADPAHDLVGAVGLHRAVFGRDVGKVVCVEVGAQQGGKGGADGALPPVRHNAAGLVVGQLDGHL